MTRFTTVVAALLFLVIGLSTANAAIIANYNTGIGPSANHPSPGAFNTWYDITSDAFATPVAGTLDGSPSLRINDGGFTNGVYIILQSVIPTTGTYTLSAAMKVVEPAAVPNGIRAYQMGAVVNGAHRPAAGDLAAINAAAAGSGVASYSGLTTGNNNGLATQIVTSDVFNATAGDHLLVAFSTDVTSGNFDLNSAGWGTAPNDAHVLVDNLDLVLQTPPTVTNAEYFNVNASDPGELMHQFMATDAQGGPFTWTPAMPSVSYMPNYGGAGTGPANAATLTSGGLFEWDSVGSPRGDYVWTVTATDSTGLSDTGTITVHVTNVPEPASLALIGLGLLAICYVGRRR